MLHTTHPHHQLTPPHPQHALGRLVPQWSSGSAAAADSGRRQAHTAAASAAAAQHPTTARRGGSDLELSALASSHSSASEGLLEVASDVQLRDGGSASRPLTGTSLSHISSSGSLGAANAANADASSVASGSISSQQHFRHTLAPPLQGSALSAGQATPSAYSAVSGDDVCSVATQIGSAPHSFSSLQSMVTTHGGGGVGDALADGGGILAAAATAAAAAGAGTTAATLGDSRSLGLPVSPTTGTPSGMSLLSAYRGSDAGGDATSVSTLPLISEAGFDEHLDVGTLTEEGEADVLDSDGEEEEDGGYGGSSRARRSSSEAGGDAPSHHHHHHQHLRPRLSSGHGSYTSDGGSSTSAAAPRLGPSPGHSARVPLAVTGSGQRGSRGSLQAAHQQQHPGLLQDLDEAPEEVAGGRGMPVPFSTRRRPDNDDTCSYATQAGSSVHSLSSVISYMERAQQQSSDGSVVSAAAASGSRSSSGRHHHHQQQHQQAHPLQQQQQVQRQHKAQQQLGGATPQAGSSSQHHQRVAFGAAGVQGRQAAAGGLSSAAVPAAGQRAAAGAADSWSGEAAASSPTQCDGSPSGLQRKGSLKGALKAVSRWGSSISQRLQRTGSGSQQQQQQHGTALQRQGSGKQHVAASQEMVGM
jgi:hypothetical protein